jgi:hypothetical protein
MLKFTTACRSGVTPSVAQTMSIWPLATASINWSKGRRFQTMRRSSAWPSASTISTSRPCGTPISSM